MGWVAATAQNVPTKWYCRVGKESLPLLFRYTYGVRIYELKNHDGERN